MVGNKLEAQNRTRDEGSETLQEGRLVLRAAADSLAALAEDLDESFVRAVESVLDCSGQVVTTGIGKAGHVATKISATLASTGTPSVYLHPADAIHGDLGRLGEEDLVMALSNSGSSEELVQLIPPIRSIGATLLAVTSDSDSPLAREADICLLFRPMDEAGHLGLAPTTSTTAMQCLGDALAMAVLSQRDFTPEEFARYHPGGALGRSLMRVSDVMRQGNKNPIASEESSLLEVLQVMTTTPGRPGAAAITDTNGSLTGFYTDGDFRRTVEEGLAEWGAELLEQPIDKFMTRDPLTIQGDRLVAEAMRLLRERKIDQLPVVDQENRPIGLLDVQDLLDVKVVL